VVRDITVRKAADEERSRLSTALDQTAESVVITDPAGMILYVNPPSNATPVICAGK